MSDRQNYYHQLSEELVEELSEVLELSFGRDSFHCEGCVAHTSTELVEIQLYFGQHCIGYDLGVHDQQHWS